jgi:hypothetical protein
LHYQAFNQPDNYTFKGEKNMAPNLPDKDSSNNENQYGTMMNHIDHQGSSKIPNDNLMVDDILDYLVADLGNNEQF